MADPELDQLLSEQLARRQDAGLLRRRQVARPIDSTHVEIDGRRYINFASNDYLGLAHHPRVVEAIAQSTRRTGAGSGAAALITGYTPDHAQAEQDIARCKGTEAAVLFPSGYQANLAAIQTLAAAGGPRKGGPFGAAFMIDKLAHASLVDGVRATGRSLRVFPHNGLGKLRRLLKHAEPTELPIVVTESIFSMDGDACDLDGLAELKKQHRFVLVLDEAHASGVYGEHGAGYAAERGLHDVVDVTMVTLSKALGCIGGAVCGSSVLCESVVNFARAYVYSTSVPPAVAAAASAGIQVMREEPQRQQRVRELAERVRAKLTDAGRQIPRGDSPIVPVIVGTAEDALTAAERLREAGLLVPAVRPPTVRSGASRLRVTLCCDHTDAEVDVLLGAMQKL